MGVKFARDWGVFKRFTGRWRKNKNDQTRREVKRQLALLRGDVIQYISSRKHGVPNSPLTVLIKGSDLPLADHGDLKKGVNVRTETSGDDIHGGVGVLRTSRTRDGRSLGNVALALHEGTVIKVTPAVRAAIYAELRRRNGGKAPAGSDRDAGGGTRNYVIKGRPFLEDPFEEALPRIKQALGDAVEVSLKR